MKNWIKNFYRNLFRKKYNFTFSDDIPVEFEDHTIYIIDKNHAWAMSFKCPCGCASHVHLNLLHNANPKWTYKIVNSKLTVFPSIDRIRGCKSHFWIRKSKIYWCY